MIRLLCALLLLLCAVGGNCAVCISRVRTKASSLSETGDLQGSIWQPGCYLDILRWKMPIRQAFCRSPGTSRQIRYIPFPVSSSLTSLALSVFLFLPLCLPQVSHLFLTLPAGCWEGGDRIPSLSASSGRAWRGSAFSRGVKQRVIQSRSWRTSCKSACPQSHAPPSWDNMPLASFPTTGKEKDENL